MVSESGKEKIKEYKYCRRCGRKLKNVDAKVRGYGPICEKKMKVQYRRPLFTI